MAKPIEWYYARHTALIDKKFAGGLRPKEERELARVQAKLNAHETVQYERTIAHLQKVLRDSRK